MNTRCIDGTELGELVEVSMAFPKEHEEPQLMIDVAELMESLSIAPLSKDEAGSSFVFTVDPLSVFRETVVDRESAEGVATPQEAWAANIRKPFA